MPKHILVPVDLTTVDKLSKALDIAGNMARENAADVHYVGVVDAVPTPSGTTVGDTLRTELAAFSDAQARKYGIKTSYEVASRSDLHLNIGSDVITAARDADCDLIVMASHIPGIKDHFLSSNAGYVASHAPMSVYVVR